MNSSLWIQTVIESFYEKAKVDILIGYHFRHIIDFESHIPRICAFWELQLLGSSEKKINPPFDILKAHVPLHIKRGELGRWIVLFKKTLEEQTKKHPEFLSLKKIWEEKLIFFEGVFLRFFGL